MLPPLGDCLVRLNARAGPAHRQPACSVRVALCTCCPLCAIKHMTQKHWCVRAAREREEGVKIHRYAVLKGCWERNIVRPPAPVQITPELPTVAVFYSRVARNLLGSREKSAVMTVMTSTPRLASHYRGEAVMRLSSQPYPLPSLPPLQRSFCYTTGFLLPFSYVNILILYTFIIIFDSLFS